MAKKKKKMKNGLKTTEFWVMALVSISSMFGLIAGLYSSHVAAIMIVLSTTAYIISRGLAKGKEVQK